METKGTSDIPQKARRWAADFGCILGGSASGCLLGYILRMNLIDAYPPVRRNWQAGWIAVLFGLLVVMVGILFIKRRDRFAGLGTAGFGLGLATPAALTLWLLKILPSS